MSDTLLPMLAAVSVFSNRIAEVVKAYLKAHTSLSIDVISEAALIVSLLAGIVAALALNLNLLVLLPADSYLASLPPLFGVILTGAIASFGSESLQWILDLASAGRERLLPPTEIAHTETVEVKDTAKVPSSPEMASTDSLSRPHR